MINKNINYRQDLEGVKFFSVLSIVLYNLDIKLFDGGFIGVDILFVLAGFFTTITLIKDYEKKSFNYFRFIENRLRRIFPILILTILISSVIVLFYQTDLELNFFLSEVLYATIFSSNFLYNNTTDFFLPLSNYLPLLQTWSISALFQIYVILGFSLAIFYPFKLNKKILLGLFVLFILGSLTMTQFGANLKFEYPFLENSNRLFFFNQPHWSGFFNLNSRIWEFLLGGIYGLIKFYNYKIFNDYKKFGFLYSFGIIVILLSIFYYSEILPHPSVYILPCLFAISFIIFNENKNSYFYKILSDKKIVFLGSMSLSVYLLHHPIIIFFDYFLYLKSEILIPIIIIIIYFVSYLANKYVEKPFNNKDIISRKNFLFFLILTFTFLFSAYGFMHFKRPINLDAKKFKLIKQNFSDFDIFIDNTKYRTEIKNYFEGMITRFNEFKNETIVKSKFNFTDGDKKKNILIIGNSHSQNLYLMLETNKDLFENYEFKFFRMHLSNHLKRNKEEKKKTDLFINDDLFKDADIVVIATNFRKYGRYSADMDSIPIINKLIKKSNKKIVLTSNTVWFDTSTSRTTNTDYPALGLMYKYSQHRNRFINNIDKELFLLIDKNESRKNTSLKKISKKLDIRFLDIFDFTCNIEELKCKTFDEYNKVLYLDSGHITLNGAKYYGRIISEINWLNLSY